MPVVGTAARSGDMPITLIGLGAVTPIATVTVQSQITGQITKVLFKEGQAVKPGDPLFQIDPRPYQVALEQAQGALARDKALLANAQAPTSRATRRCFAQDSIAEQTLATQKSLVVQDEGTVKTDQAAGRCREAQPGLRAHRLAHQRARRPAAGESRQLRHARRNRTVSSSSRSCKPITVVFSLPEDQIPPLLKQLHAGKTLAGHRLRPHQHH